MLQRHPCNPKEKHPTERPDPKANRTCPKTATPQTAAGPWRTAEAFGVVLDLLLSWPRPSPEPMLLSHPLWQVSALPAAAKMPWHALHQPPPPSPQPAALAHGEPRIARRSACAPGLRPCARAGSTPHARESKIVRGTPAWLPRADGTCAAEVEVSAEVCLALLQGGVAFFVGYRHFFALRYLSHGHDE